MSEQNGDLPIAHRATAIKTCFPCFVFLKCESGMDRNFHICLWEKINMFVFWTVGQTKQAL